MARVTVEDCIDKVDNRFDLVLLAAHRARMISSGSQLTVDRDNDKNPVVSLREIAESSISPEDLREELVHSLQKFVEVDEPEPDTVPLIGSAGASVDADDTEVAVERMTEEELLKGLEGLAPAGRAARRRRVIGAVARKFTQRPGQLSGPLLLLTFFGLRCVLDTTDARPVPGRVQPASRLNWSMRNGSNGSA